MGVCSGERVMDVPDLGGVLSFSIESPPPATPVGALYIQLRNSLLGNLDVLGSFVYSLAEPTVVKLIEPAKRTRTRSSLSPPTWALARSLRFTLGIL